jgi:hypothetical protein
MKRPQASATFLSVAKGSTGQNFGTTLTPRALTD